MDPLDFQPLDVTAARTITTWDYSPPYDLYNIHPGSISVLLEADYRYHGAFNPEGCLVGFCCFGADARVPGGRYHSGEPETLDIGLGLRPDLTGQGWGQDFLTLALDFAADRFQPDIFRASIAAFNLRSRKTFQRVGFKENDAFIHQLTGDPFWLLEMEADQLHLSR